nr:aminotransferase class V-fold PLP-dependent enzyme [Acinetobacter sp. Marseille-Q1620]
MNNKIIYLDYAATTPVLPEISDELIRCLNFNGVFGNPASRSHQFGWKAEEKVEYARKQIADVIHADPREIIWTSGATESNNLAIKGISQFYASKGKHIITSQIEHKAVLDTCYELEQQGYEVTYLKPEPFTGIIHPQSVAKALRPDTILVSLMFVNNEIGTLTDIEKVGELTRNNHTFFHVDAAQAAGKIDIDLSKLNVDLMSFSGHKIYAPKGIGALYISRHPRVHLKAQIHGGGHENGFRSGTLATHQIVAMGKAFELAKAKIESEQNRLKQLKNKLWHGLNQFLDVRLNGDLQQSVANYLNVSFIGKHAEQAINIIKNIAAVSSGSACSSHQAAPSHVLRALGISDEHSISSIRFSFGTFTTERDIHTLLDAINQIRLQSLQIS